MNITVFNTDLDKIAFLAEISKRYKFRNYAMGNPTPVLLQRNFTYFWTLPHPNKHFNFQREAKLMMLLKLTK